MADIQNGTITITGLDAFEKKIKELESTNPGFEKRLRGVIRKVLGEVRAALQKDAQSGLQMQSDPRKAYKAVRYAVYKRILGGQVNILDGKGNPTGKVFYEPQRHPSLRGGNRIKRKSGGRTEQLMSYSGKQRGFVLRFLNAGTKPRYAGYGRNGRTQEEYDRFVANHDGRGFRGSIQPRNWFGQASQRELEGVAEKMQAIIDKVINDEFI